jgi:transposase InsO family protein
LRHLLRAADVARSVYYYWRKALHRPDAYAHEKRLIEAIFHKHKSRYGYRRIMWALRAQGHWLNHKTVQKLMGQLGIKSTVRPKRYTSYRGRLSPAAPNTLDRCFEAGEPNTKWVTDVTEFNIRGQKVFLSPILDLYNREIVSYEIATTPHLRMVMTMLDRAFIRLKGHEDLILHSDQGWQYQMDGYRTALSEQGIGLSMSRRGNCHDNAVMENFFGILKSEFFHGHLFASVDVFTNKLHDYINYYNHDRIKEKLKGLSPVNYRTQAFSAA